MSETEDNRRRLVEEVAYLVSGLDEYWFYEYPCSEFDRERHRKLAATIIDFVREDEDQ